MKTCFECNAPAECNHHVIPRVRGGTKTVPLCAVCHAKAHGRKSPMTTGSLTRQALRHKRAQGFKNGGDVPFGFSLMPGGRLAEHPEEQKALRHMKELRAKGYTLRAIAAELEKEGYRTRRGLAKWQAKSVQRIIERAAA